MTKENRLLKHLKRGLVYRRSDFINWSTRVDRDLAEAPIILDKLLGILQQMDKKKMADAIAKYANASAKKLLLNTFKTSFSIFKKMENDSKSHCDF